MDNNRKCQIFFSLNTEQSRADSQMSATADRAGIPLIPEQSPALKPQTNSFRYFLIFAVF